ncbi:MAG: hypothetical protein EP301_07340 [Gammaproteobacteria bacterium]|jgi:hypothetical protein|nr:MAG: hypothetical protein EP301_07340 [Gammaproteobacteria bacterium]
MLQYWRFYWPLALTGVAMVLSVQFQNAALARYPEAVTELAIYALGYGVFGFFRASLNFIAQLTTVFARSVEATRRCHRYVFGVSVLIMLPLIYLGHSDGGAWLLSRVFGTDVELTIRVQEYLIYLAPVVILGAQRFYYTGLLVQARLTGWVTVLNLTFLVAVITGLVIGFSLGYRPVYVLVGSEALAIALQLLLIVWVKRTYYRPPEVAEYQNVTYRELTAFFIPVSMTGVMFALSRPVLFAFVSRLPDGIAAIAAMRVAFDFSMLFQQAANQFRHFFVTFGLDDLPGKRRFMGLIGTSITAIMLIFALTPLSAWVWRDLMSIPEEVLTMSVQVFLIMCLMPAIIIVRNYFHGRLMVERRTSGMAVGSALRVIGIYIGAWLCFELGWLNHVTASILLIMGFMIETAVVIQAAARGKGERENATANR